MARHPNDRSLTTMPRQIFVNLPVQDVARTKAFFSALGFEFNPQFSNDTALCMVIADGIHAMLLHTDFFKTFTQKPWPTPRPRPRC
jgi:predicted lactoylglutathione lyase